MLQLTNYNNTPVITNEEISNALELQLDSVNRMIEKYFDKIKKYGLVGFEIGAKNKKTYYLNEDQALFLGSLSKNNEKVVDFKQMLVSEFSKLRKQPVIKTPDQLSTLDILKLTYGEIEKLQNQVQKLVHDPKTYTSTEIAKEMGLNSARQLNNLLYSKGIHYKVNDTWVLYSNYQDKGYTSIKQSELPNGRIVYDRRWTGIGRDFILNL